jgi:hypothetical protein
MATGAVRSPSAARRGRIASAAHLDPFQQGEFDGLCGIYAAVNGLRLLLQPHRPLTYSACEQLYQAGIASLRRESQLAGAATWGISQARWLRLVPALCTAAARITNLPISATQPFPNDRRVSRAQAFASIESAIDAQCPVLVELDDTYDHFTVISGYAPTRFMLHDSYGYRWIRKDACGVTADRGEWRHRLATKSILILSLGPQPA